MEAPPPCKILGFKLPPSFSRALNRHFDRAWSQIKVIPRHLSPPKELTLKTQQCITFSLVKWADLVALCMYTYTFKTFLSSWQFPTKKQEEKFNSYYISVQYKRTETWMATHLNNFLSCIIFLPDLLYFQWIMPLITLEWGSTLDGNMWLSNQSTTYLITLR